MLSKIVALFAVAGSASAAMDCPSSGSKVHAGCQVTTVFEDSCSTVQQEVTKRINGQSSGAWTDPHNNGTYSILADPAGLPATWQLQRITGDQKYTDLINFVFSENGSGCQLDGCSESQVFSIGDYGTNFCNIHDLYCNEAGCNSFNKLTYDEKAGKCTDDNVKQCIA
mmetsp:Transcript_1540/g.2709  ORF Transcript_1540/g.2709 Transcript_1540/m.2709 type:complete len:168 (-) Transcript_1540:263-766(-)